MYKKSKRTETLIEIKRYLPDFKKENLLEYTKWAIPSLYNSLKNNKKIEVEATEELIQKLKINKPEYRITTDIDHINLQYTAVIDCIKENDEIYVKVYSSIYFYDNVRNNVFKDNLKDKYFNDIWIITYKIKKRKEDKEKLTCGNCGAVMQYNSKKMLLECKYCGNNVFYNRDANWIMTDINIEGENGLIYMSLLEGI